MRLSALDIRKQEFGRAIRGYDPDDVEAFMTLIAQQWQEMADELNRLEHKVNEVAGKLTHYEKVEEALQEALETARDGAKQRLETADKEAESIISSAERKAVTIIDDAEQRARGLVGEAGEGLAQARADVAEVVMRRNEIVAQLRSFLSAELELISGYGKYSAESGAGDIHADSEYDLSADESADMRASTSETDVDYEEEVDRDETDATEESFDEPSDEAVSSNDVLTDDADYDDEEDWEDEPVDEAEEAGDDVPHDQLDDDEPGASDEIRKIRSILEDLDR